jgi:GT2 family glycosyltransferase
MKRVGIILVNYQNYARKFLDSCRDSLRAQTYADFKVYLIDNASTAESATYLRTAYPEATIILRADGNYCAANNAGMKQALADQCEYLVAANMDTEFFPDWLTELVKALDNNPEAGLAQSLILLAPKTDQEKDKPLINTTGNLIHFLFFGFTENYQRPLSAWSVSSDYPEIKGYASGCSLMMRAEVFKIIGGYNEDYYMYHDDLDVSLKARLAGYKIILAPQSRLYHKYEFERSVKMLYYMERNRILSFLTFYPAGARWLLSPALVIMDLGMLLFSIFNGWFGTKLKIYAYFLSPETHRKIKQERLRLSHLAKVPRRQISASFKGRIEFQEIANPVLKYLVNPLFNAYWQLVKKII